MSTDNPYVYVKPKNPRHYQMGWCKKCKRRYRLPMSADPTLPAPAQGERCFSIEMEKFSRELAKVTGKSAG